MTVAIATIPDSDRLTAASWLQKLLPQLVALTLNAKQAHWNVSGPGFLPLHALTDAIATDTRVWSDRVAERALALGFVVDARPRRVAAVGEQLPAGRVSDLEVIDELAAIIAEVVTTARASLPELDRGDAVAHGVVVEVLEGLEKYLWMLRAQSL
jgi:starvation-inducible DNA-binding protein